MEETIFTKIIKGDIPSHKVYEDDQTFAFMDINPTTECQVLVIPKKQIDNIEDLPENLYATVWQTVHKVTNALRAVYKDVKKIGIQVEGLEVPHAHVKIFPFNTANEFRAVPSGADPDHDKLEEIAQEIRKEIQNV